ncbi:hypothetical protein HHI36_001316 [Cryptolaemus montrouzieri]|uniref:Uncharacterized protein n=1 Tax=Cryptolaemus montrouzieri TaxID=559131 RepID=A0ABD2P7Z5_9CUCU
MEELDTEDEVACGNIEEEKNECDDNELMEIIGSESSDNGSENQDSAESGKKTVNTTTSGENRDDTDIKKRRREPGTSSEEEKKVPKIKIKFHGKSASIESEHNLKDNEEILSKNDDLLSQDMFQ